MLVKIREEKWEKINEGNLKVERVWVEELKLSIYRFVSRIYSKFNFGDKGLIIIEEGSGKIKSENGVMDVKKGDIVYFEGNSIEFFGYIRGIILV